MANRTDSKSKAVIITSVAALVLSAVFCLARWPGGSGPAESSLTPAVQAVNQNTTGPLPHSDATTKMTVTSDYGRLPLYFIENRGQVARRIKYYSQDSGQTVGFTREGLVMALRRGEALPSPERERPESDCRRGEQLRPVTPALPELEKGKPAAQTSPPTLVRLTPVGMRRGVKVAARERQDYYVNYFRGNDPTKWRANVPTYKAVVYQEAYPGIDLKFYGAGRQLEYDIIVRPGADPNRVAFKYEGVRGLKLTPAGDLAILLPDGGELIQKKPVVYQEINGARVAREGKFKLQGGETRHSFGFEVAAYDRQRPLVIDPVLVYATYLGGYPTTYGSAIAVDQAGYAWVAGTTRGGLPTNNALYFEPGGREDVFVSKISPNGDLSFSTYLGDEGNDRGLGIAVDGAGNAYVTGSTYSWNFPVLNSAVTYINPADGAAFAAKINAAGTALLWSTCLGTLANTVGHGIAVDAGNAYGYHNVYVAGYAADYYPAQGASTTFLAKLSEYNQNPVKVQEGWYYTWAAIEAYGVAVGQAGNVYVCGTTYSSAIPGYRGTVLPDAFVFKMNDAGNGWFYYLGGDGVDEARGIALDQSGNAYVTGFTTSSSFAGVSVAPLYAYSGSPCDAFVMKIREVPALPSGVAPAAAYFTYLGSGSPHYGCFGNAIAVDAAGSAHVVGHGYSGDEQIFPLQAPLLNAPRWGTFVTKLNAAGSALVYSTFMPGYGFYGLGIAVDQAGHALVAGHTDYGYPPSRQAFQPTFASDPHYNSNAYIAKLSPRAVAIVPLPKLLAFYPLDGDTKDASGRNRHATASGASPTPSGFVGPSPIAFEGTCYDFDGVGDSIQAPVNINPSLYPKLTIGCWARAMAPYTTPIRYVLSHDNGFSDRSINIDNRGGGTGWSALCGSAGVLYGGPVVPGKWTFLAAVYDQPAQTVTLYVDDQVVTKTNATLGNGRSTLLIGAYPTNYHYFGGFIDNVFVFADALNSGQIDLIRNYGASALRTAPRAPLSGTSFLGLLLND